jgi:hypothetical protein
METNAAPHDGALRFKRLFASAAGPPSMQRTPIDITRGYITLSPEAVVFGRPAVQGEHLQIRTQETVGSDARRSTCLKDHEAWRGRQSARRHSCERAARFTPARARPLDPTVETGSISSFGVPLRRLVRSTARHWFGPHQASCPDSQTAAQPLLGIPAASRR